MPFVHHKIRAMKGYNECKSKGLVDKDLIKYLDKFNKLKHYYTTSSCSGRILLIRNNKLGKKMPKAFYFKTHNNTTSKNIIDLVNKFNEDYELWFKLEPYILHIGCETIEHARKLLAYCKSIGIKRAGINAWSKRIIVEVIGTHNIETIIVKDKKILVSSEYLKVLIKKANTKMKQSKKVLYSFFKGQSKLKDH